MCWLAVCCCSSHWRLVTSLHVRLSGSIPYLPYGTSEIVTRTIAYLGVPTSLGSYGPGQEKAPQAFRKVGFPDMLRKEGLTVVEFVDILYNRWFPDIKLNSAQHCYEIV